MANLKAFFTMDNLKKLFGPSDAKDVKLPSEYSPFGYWIRMFALFSLIVLITLIKLMVVVGLLTPKVK